MDLKMTHFLIILLFDQYNNSRLSTLLLFTYILRHAQYCILYKKCSGVWTPYMLNFYSNSNNNNYYMTD